MLEKIPSEKYNVLIVDDTSYSFDGTSQRTINIAPLSIYYGIGKNFIEQTLKQEQINRIQ